MGKGYRCLCRSAKSNPPLAALAIHHEHAFEGDTNAERQQEWNKVSNDIVNLVLMIKLEKVSRFNTDEYEFIDKIKNSLAQESRSAVLDKTLSFEHLNLNRPEEEMLSATHHINLSTHRLPELDKALFSEATLNAQGIFRYSDPHSAVEKLAICIENRFYAVRPGTFQGRYILDDDREIVFFDGSDVERKQHPLEHVKYTECRARRSPGTSCIRISASTQDALTRNRDKGLTKEDAMIIGRDPAHPALFINIEGKKFIGSDERFFRIKEKENVFTLYARKGTGLLSSLRPRKKIATFQFSQLQGVVYCSGELSPKLRATFKPGVTLLVKKCVSTSADKHIALAHKADKADKADKGPHQALYKIHVNHAAHAINGFTRNLHEAEVLIEDRTLFRCVSIEGDNVELEEVLDVTPLDERNIRIASI